jgi:hypothetical protein
MALKGGTREHEMFTRLGRANRYDGSIGGVEGLDLVGIISP